MVRTETEASAAVQLAMLDETPETRVDPSVFEKSDFFRINPYDMTATSGGPNARSQKAWKELGEHRIGAKTEPTRVLEEVLEVAGVDLDAVRPYLLQRYTLYDEMVGRETHATLQQAVHRTNPSSVLNQHFTVLQEVMFDRVNGSLETLIGRAQHVGIFVVDHAKSDISLLQHAS